MIEELTDRDRARDVRAARKPFLQRVVERELARVAELQAQGLAPAGGAVALTIPSSYGDTSAAEFSFYPLAEGRSFRNFVLAYNARLVNTGPESGCGMYFRDAGFGNQDALVFEDGYYLLGEWDVDGTLLENSFYEYSEAVLPGQGATNAVVKTISLAPYGEPSYVAVDEARRDTCD